jgi:hypothetical protein
MSKQYTVVSGGIFCFVAIAQATRAFLEWPVQIDTLVVPVGASWLAAIVAGSLCVWAFRLCTPR